MKPASMSVWIFFNLLCFGMCGYMYLVWYQYWTYSQKKPLTMGDASRNVINDQFVPSDQSKVQFTYSSLINPFRKARRSAVGSFWRSRVSQQTNNTSSASQKVPSNNVVTSQGRPRFTSAKNMLKFDTEQYVCDDILSIACKNLNENFKKVLQQAFFNILEKDGNVFTSGLDAHNIYDVKYKRGKSNLSETSTSDQILCALKDVKLRTVKADDEPFTTLNFKIPSRALQQDRLYNNCAVVTSAGSLLGTGYGEYIDNHDMVLRFNNAPTENYTEDVGSKTTFRVLNSQVVAKPEFQFLDNPLYQNVSILIWDPANDSSSLKDWYLNPDHPFFPVYKQLLEKRKDADVHLLHPQVLWDLWTILQDTTSFRLRKHPPSSGFIGLWFALQRCTRVRMLEYVPSVHASSRCHYYEKHKDKACTLGAWHPLAYEKSLADKLRYNSDINVYQQGIIEILGFSTLSNCDKNL